MVHGSLGPHVLAIDFDGVCAKFDGSKGAELLGAPTRGLREFLHALRAAGWKIILHSCRPEWRLEQWAFDHGIHFDGYNENPYFAGDDMEMSSKPPATAYLDDRAVRFTGDFDAAFAGVMEIADREGHP